MNQKLLALYGLKYNRFIPEVPIEALYCTISPLGTAGFPELGTT
jgi:hypothetical protein